MVAKALVGVVVALAVGVQALHPFTLRSPAFMDGGRLPASSEYRGGFGCHGLNRAPLLTWSGVPAGTRSFALAILDPGAAPFIPGG